MRRSSVSGSLLCAATVALWASSYRTRLRSHCAFARRSSSVSTGFRASADHFGSVTTWNRTTCWPPPRRASGTVAGSSREPTTGEKWPYGIGSGLATSRSSAATCRGFIVVPQWSAVLLLSAIPLVRIIQRLKARFFRSPGLCASCGYGLRATLSRCPECGNSVVTKDLEMKQVTNTAAAAGARTARARSLELMDDPVSQMTAYPRAPSVERS